MVAAAERAELHKTIWRIANDLRGSVDGWDFKSYVLGFLFYRFISENLTGYLNEKERQGILAAGGSQEEADSFDFATLPKEKAELGRAATVADKDEPAYVLRYGKPIAVVISNERYERLMSEGIDPSEH